MVTKKKDSMITNPPKALSFRVALDILALIWPIVGFFATFKVMEYRLNSIELRQAANEVRSNTVGDSLKDISERQVRVETKLDMLIDATKAGK